MNRLGLILVLGFYGFKYPKYTKDHPGVRLCSVVCAYACVYVCTCVCMLKVVLQDNIKRRKHNLKSLKSN